MRKKYKECWKNEDWQGVLRAARADVTKYTMCHKSHTVPAKASGFVYATNLFEVDIDALADYVEFLMWAYQKNGLLDKLPAALERLRNNVVAERWNQKIIYFQTLCALGEEWDIDAGRKEIVKLGPIDEINDIELKAFYLNLIRRDLSMSEQLKIADNIIQKSGALSTKVHQGTVKALLLFGHKDRKGAIETLGETIRLLEEQDEENLNSYQRNKFAQCLYFLGCIGIDSQIEKNEPKGHEFIIRAIRHFEFLVDNDEFSDAGNASLYRGLADCYRVIDEWSKAIPMYQKAYSLDLAAIHRVFEAECLYEIGKPEQAFQILDEIQMSSLTDEDCRNDFEVRFSRIAIQEKCISRLNKARDLLQENRVLNPHFHGQRQKILVEVLTTIAENKNATPTNTSRFKLGLKKVSSGLMLQPNFFGIGININKIIQGDSDLPDNHKRIDSNNS